MDSIIFDLDGTLWDSRMAIINVWKDVLSRYDVGKKEITLEEMKNSMGRQVDEIGKMYFPHLDNDMRMKLMDECCNLECDYLTQHGGVLYSNLEEVLDKLHKKYKLFIVSNCQSGYIESFLDFHNLHKYFTDYECPGVTNLSKGENNKLIIKRNNLKSPIYVGDTQGDADSASHAGIPFVYAAYGFGQVSHYDYIINEFSDLLSIL